MFRTVAGLQQEHRKRHRLRRFGRVR